MLPFTKLFGIIHPRTVIAHKKLLFCNRKKDDSESNHVVLFGTDGPSMPKIAPLARFTGIASRLAFMLPPFLAVLEGSGFSSLAENVSAGTAR